MTPQQTQLVQETWSQVGPLGDTAAELFYGRLFELDPTLRPLFPGDMTEQRRKLMQMLAVAVANLHRLEEIVPAVQALGRRHADYGVREQDYDTVASALLWTLAQGLGPAFTADAEEAWTCAYRILATTMIEASQRVGAV